ncbi:hypothetical protein [Kordia sp.]|uniref:hypothetical protein n=1 Tax=Kordia sp. TaxID=1965332 RepID=UPI003D284CAB
MENNYIKFNKLFSEFQKKSRTVDNYNDYEAFKDMKIILGDYVEIYDKRAYKYYDLTVSKVKKMLSSFDVYMTRDLLSFFIKKLVLNGNTDKAKEMIKYLNEVEIKCSWSDLIKGKNKRKNILKLIHRCSAYNLWTLIISITIIILFSILIFSPAHFECMELLEIQKKQIVSSTFFNDLFNLMLYIFDTDYKMGIKPLNGLGVLLIISLKSLFIVIIFNYLVRELMDKLKIS